MLGHAAANRMPTLRDRAAKLREDPRERVRRWRLHYFVDCCRLIQFTTILEMRLGDRITPAKRRELARFARAERSPVALAALARGAARELGEAAADARRGDGPLLCVRLAEARGRGVTRAWEAPPPAADRCAAAHVAHARARAHRLSNIAVGTLAAKIAPLELAFDENAPARVNILIPTIDLTHFFGGYITKLNLARRLAERGARVRIVTVDPVGAAARGLAADARVL